MSEKNTVTVHNLTDVATDTLKAYGLVEQQIAVDKDLVRPGESVEVPRDPHTLAKLGHLIEVGAVALDQLPPTYVSAKSAPKPAPAPQPAEEAPVEAMEESGSKKRR